MLLTLWYLSNQETFRQISDRFNVTESSSYRVLKKIIEYFTLNSKKYIYWPNESQRDSISNGFKEMQNIGSILGAIDGCHINIRKPTKNHECYCNRKSQYSILLQGVCDYRKKFLDVFCGEPGSIHDARLLKKSSLYVKGLNGFFQRNFLIGDSAYPCLNWLIVPFKDNGSLTRNQKTFNYRLSSSRIVIENAFGLLKGRFRRLKYFENKNIMFITKCVVTATVLHNICIDFNDCLEAVDLSSEADETVYCVSNISHAFCRRNEIFNEMFND